MVFCAIIPGHITCAAGTENYSLNSHLLSSSKSDFSIIESRSEIGLRPRKAKPSGDKTITASQRNRKRKNLIALKLPIVVAFIRNKRSRYIVFHKVISYRLEKRSFVKAATYAEKKAALIFSLSRV